MESAAKKKNSLAMGVIGTMIVWASALLFSSAANASSVGHVGQKSRAEVSGPFTAKSVELLDANPVNATRYYDASFEAALECTVAPSNAVHKNSRAYQGDSHVYDIKAPDGSVHKVGKSSAGTTAEGYSKRAEAQVRRLNREDIENGGVGGFESNIRRTFDNSSDALDHEAALRDRYRKMFGEDLLPGNREHLRGKRKN
jgi:hypothetical protein